jgi:hypothetical protein
MAEIEAFQLFQAGVGTTARIVRPTKITGSATDSYIDLYQLAQTLTL